MAGRFGRPPFQDYEPHSIPQCQPCLQCLCMAIACPWFCPSLVRAALPNPTHNNGVVREHLKFEGVDSTARAPLIVQLASPHTAVE
jgi:hypothetical protein